MRNCPGSRFAPAGGLVVALALLLAAPSNARAQMQAELGIGAAIPTADLANTTKPGPFVGGLIGVLAHPQITISARGSASWYSGKTVFSSGAASGSESDITFITYGIGLDVNGMDRLQDWMLLFQAFGGFTSLDVGSCAAPCAAPTAGGSETDFTFWAGFQAMYKINRSWAIGGGARYYVVFSSGANLTSLPLIAAVRWTAGQ